MDSTQSPANVSAAMVPWLHVSRAQSAIVLFFSWILLYASKGCATVVINNGNIASAVNEWVSNEASATQKYGHIAQWDTSRVTELVRSEFFLNPHGS